MYISGLLILMLACWEKTNYFPTVGRVMSTVYIWMEIRTLLPELAIRRQNKGKRGRAWKQDAVEFKWIIRSELGGCVWKYFHADEVHYPKSLKEDHRSAWVFKYIFVLVHLLLLLNEFKFCPQSTTNMPRFYKSRCCYLLHVNFGKYESVLNCFHIFCCERPPELKGNLSYHNRLLTRDISWLISINIYYSKKEKKWIICKICCWRMMVMLEKSLCKL